MNAVMSISNKVILEVVNCIVSPICEPGYLPINYDDFISVLRDGELSYISVGAGDGKNAIQDAIQSTIHNPLSTTKMSALNNILISRTCGTDMDVPDIQTIGDDIRDAVAPKANIELAAKRLLNWNNKVRIGLIGFDDGKESSKDPKCNLHMDRFENMFNDELNSVFTKAEELAKKFETNYTASEHLVYAMLLTDCKAGEILNECGCDKKVFESFFVKSIYSSSAIIGYIPRTKMIIQNAKDDLILKKGSGVPIGTEHLLNSRLSVDSLAGKIITAMNLDMKRLNELLEEAINS